jgi:SAM-dependent methyltransferase
MNPRHFSLLYAAIFAVSCTRKDPALDSQIGRTTYDGSEAMQPASRTVTPAPAASSAVSFPSDAGDAAEDEAPPRDTMVPRGEATSAAAEATEPARTPDVIYVPTPRPVVDKMLELARVGKDDLVYDLGCGDGRIVVTAAKRYGARAVGFDIDPARIEEARRNVEKNKVGHLVTIEQKDIFTLDLAPASVVTLYLLPKLNDRLVPQLARLAPGSRVVSHNYDFTGMVPVQALDMKPSGEDDEHSVFLYTMPFKKARSLALPPQPAPRPAVP